MTLGTPEHVYSNDLERAGIYSSLIKFANEMFNSAYIVKNLDDYKNIEKVWKDADTTFEKRRELTGPFSEESFLDSIKIIAAIESFLKAKLLRDNFVIFEIDSNRTPELKKIGKAQKRKPILLSDMREEIDAQELSKESLYLKDHTLGMSVLFRENYWSQFSLSDEVRAFLEGLNRSRNQLHFLIGYVSVYHGGVFFRNGTYLETLKEAINKTDVEYQKILEDLIRETELQKG